ncbi:DUF2796 domain-containing protein [Ruegeria sp. A3M17]|uniref:ZrgA family zinc uptake protein n=1 Tax=Ruegeria sp. A3M17 TaxID=2267229 RepID=UPI000DE817C2|nr:DUF2796 domain-containing protein [Ruegeria sp. A3M17]RBW58705.1 hypothetical protein DS906_07840 [Ruegeria sp. A3M17]
MGGALFMKCAAIALILTPAIVLSQVQGPAHEHGTGYVDIAFSDQAFTLSLNVPSADIIDFAGPAETDDDRAQVAVAVSDLSKPLGLFVLPEEAGCVTASANVTLTGEGLGQDNTNESADQDQHSDFLADYLIQCQDITALVSIRFAYFERFENAQKLILQVTRSGQSRTYEITRNQPDLAM